MAHGVRDRAYNLASQSLRLKVHNFVLQNAADERNSLQMKTAVKLRHRDIAVPNNPVLETECPIWVAMTFATLNRSHWFLNTAQTGVVADYRTDELFSLPAFVRRAATSRSLDESRPSLVYRIW